MPAPFLLSITSPVQEMTEALQLAVVLRFDRLVIVPASSGRAARTWISAIAHVIPRTAPRPRRRHNAGNRLGHWILPSRVQFRVRVAG